MDNWFVILLRSVSLLILTFVLMRLYGKRNLAKTTPFTFVYYTVIAVIAAAISVNLIQNVALGLVGLFVWFTMPFLLEFGALKSKWFHDVIYGKETILIKQGKILEENMLKSRLTGDELLRDLRGRNVFNIADVEFAVLENDGGVNVYLKADKKPVTPSDMDLKPAPCSEPQTVILDGNVHNEGLSNLGLSRLWLNQQLDAMGISLDNVFIGQVESTGDLYVDLFDDSIEAPRANAREMVFANLEKAQADLTIYALETEDEKAKSMYQQNAERLKQVMHLLKPYLIQ